MYLFGGNDEKNIPTDELYWISPDLKANQKTIDKKLGEYKDVEISLPEADQMLIKGRVGFMSRTVEWVRVDEMPAH